MRDARINADHQVHQAAKRGSVGKIVELIAQVHEIFMLQPDFALVTPLLLQADELETPVEYPTKRLCFYSAIVIVFECDAAAPDHPDARLRLFPKPLLPLRQL